MLDPRASDKIFQATIERRLALLLGDALGTGRRFKRATSVGNNSVQVCKSSVLCGLILFMLSMHELIGFVYRALPACLMPLWILNQSLSLWHIPTPALPPRIIIQGQGVSMATLSYSSLACRATQKTTISPLSAVGASYSSCSLR